MQYSQFTSEVLNDKKTSNEYKSHLCEIGTEAKDVIDEDNICNLDLNNVVRND